MEKISGTDSQSVNQEQYLQETLGIAITALSNLVYQLGVVLEELEIQLSTLTKRSVNSQSNSKPDQDGVSGQIAAENSVLDEIG